MKYRRTQVSHASRMLQASLQKRVKYLNICPYRPYHPKCGRYLATSPRILPSSHQLVLLLHTQRRVCLAGVDKIQLQAVDRWGMEGNDTVWEEVCKEECFQCLLKSPSDILKSLPICYRNTLSMWLLPCVCQGMVQRRCFSHLEASLVFNNGTFQHVGRFLVSENPGLKHWEATIFDLLNRWSKLAKPHPTALSLLHLSLFSLFQRWGQGPQKSTYGKICVYVICSMHMGTICRYANWNVYQKIEKELKPLKQSLKMFLCIFLIRCNQNGNYKIFFSLPSLPQQTTLRIKCVGHHDMSMSYFYTSNPPGEMGNTHVQHQVTSQSPSCYEAMEKKLTVVLLDGKKIIALENTE